MVWTLLGNPALRTRLLENPLLYCSAEEDFETDYVTIACIFSEIFRLPKEFTFILPVYGPLPEFPKNFGGFEVNSEIPADRFSGQFVTGDSGGVRIDANDNGVADSDEPAVTITDLGNGRQVSISDFGGISEEEIDALNLSFYASDREEIPPSFPEGKEVTLSATDCPDSGSSCTVHTMLKSNRQICSGYAAVGSDSSIELVTSFFIDSPGLKPNAVFAVCRDGNGQQLAMNIPEFFPRDGGLLGTIPGCTTKQFTPTPVNPVEGSLFAIYSCCFEASEPINLATRYLTYGPSASSGGQQGQVSGQGLPSVERLGSAGVAAARPGLVQSLRVTKEQAAEGLIDTAVAIRNATGRSNVIELYLTSDDNTRLGPVELTLDPYALTARFALEFFVEMQGETSFGGTLLAISDTAFSITTLETLNGFQKTSLPATSLN